jgi:hypothetical protein
MTVTRLWAQKHPKCFDPENDVLLLDFELQKTEATELIREYFGWWERDEYNQKVIEVIGGAFPHFDSWWEEVEGDFGDSFPLTSSSDPEVVVASEACELVELLQNQLNESGGELFMEVN